MFGTMINVLTAPSETMESIVNEFNWKQALYPITLLMSLAIISGIILSDQIADIQWDQMEKSISNNSNIPEEQKGEILSNQYDRIYGQSNSWAGMATYFSMAISWPIRIAFWTLFAMIAANFAPKHRNQIILWGVFGALLFRIVFAFFASYLFGFAYIKILGGLLLIWIVNDLRINLFNQKKIKSPTKISKEPSYIQSVYKVLFADITLSFDNVIGVVGASKNNVNLMLFGSGGAGGVPFILIFIFRHLS